MEARGSDTIANAASIESCKTETAQPEPELDSNLASEPGISQASADSVGQPSLPAKSLPAVNETGVKAGWREGGRREREERVEVSLQSLSQLSLSRSTPVKVGGEMRRVAKSKFRPRVAQSSFPVMKAMEQRTKRVPIRAAQKPRSFLPILPKRKTKERQPLIPSKGIIIQLTHSPNNTHTMTLSSLCNVHSDCRESRVQDGITIPQNYSQTQVCSKER